MKNDDEWGPGTAIIIILLALIAAKLHAFDGLFAGLTNPTVWVVVIAIGLALVAIVVVWLMLREIFRGFGDVWNRIPERVRFFGIALLLIATSTFWFVYHRIP